MPTIVTRVESARGCGFRKPGGLYIMGGKLATACGKLPIELDICPCCGAGIKFSRGFQWISSDLVNNQKCSLEPLDKCRNCRPWDDPRIERLGLLWVGEKFYPTPADFIKEGNMAGISKRVSYIPKGLVVGESWILLAHIKAITKINYSGDLPLADGVTHKKGIFAAFKPTSIEYVVTGNETDEDLEDKEARGITLVKVTRDVEAQVQIEDTLQKFKANYRKEGATHQFFMSAYNKVHARRIFAECTEQHKSERLISIKPL